MAITSSGYDGGVTEAQWAAMAPLLGAKRGGVSGDGDLAVATTGGTRAVSVAAGTAWGWGVLDVSDAVVNISLDDVGSGVRWDSIVLRRNWSGTGGTSTIIKLNGTTTQAPSTSLASNAGVQADQLLALVQITAGNSTPTQVIDMRDRPSVVLTSASLGPYALYPLGTVKLVNGVLYRRGAGGWAVDHRDSSSITVGGYSGALSWSAHSGFLSLVLDVTRTDARQTGDYLFTTLPAAVRPTRRHRIALLHNATPQGAFEVNTNGTVYARGIDATTGLNLTATAVCELDLLTGVF